MSNELREITAQNKLAEWAGKITACRNSGQPAIMFSLIQTAIENGLDPYKYLTWLLKQVKAADLTDDQAIQSSLPWNVPTELRTK